MYCLTCACEYSEWTGKCPLDGTPLVERPPVVATAAPDAVPYETIARMLRNNGGSREVELSTSAIVRERTKGFPYRGYGFAWARTMEGSLDGIAVTLRIDEVGLEKAEGFPYQGYGLAWEHRMCGWVGGQEITLVATRVAREKKLLFPYRGHGYAWAEELSGDCGPLIRAEMRTTDVGRDRNWFMFYFGFGYAWINRAKLRLTLSARQRSTSPA